MPWCPNCRSEYRSDISVCSEPDCDNTPLVAELPPDPEIVEIYTAADPLEAQHLAGLLRDANIEVAIADHTNHVFPTPSSDPGAARIAVIAADATAARALIQSARDDEVISDEGEFLT